MIILNIALTLTEYEIVLKDLIKRGLQNEGRDAVELWAALEIGRQVDLIRKGESHESDGDSNG